MLKSKSSTTSNILSEIFNKNYTSELKTKKQSSQPISYFQGKLEIKIDEYQTKGATLNDFIIEQEVQIPRSQTPDSSTFKLFETEKKPSKRFYKACEIKRA